MQGYCARCDQNVEMVITPGNPHNRADCPLCGRWIKWVEHEVNPADEIMYFGKYKDKKFSDIPLNYLQWLLDNLESNLRPRQRKNLIKHISDRAEEIR